MRTVAKSKFNTFFESYEDLKDMYIKNAFKNTDIKIYKKNNDNNKVSVYDKLILESYLSCYDMCKKEDNQIWRICVSDLSIPYNDTIKIINLKNITESGRESDEYENIPMKFGFLYLLEKECDEYYDPDLREVELDFISCNGDLNNFITKPSILLSSYERCIRLAKKYFDEDFSDILDMMGAKYEDCRQMCNRLEDNDIKESIALDKGLDYIDSIKNSWKHRTRDALKLISLEDRPYYNYCSNPTYCNDDDDYDDDYYDEYCEPYVKYEFDFSDEYYSNKQASYYDDDSANYSPK